MKRTTTQKTWMAGKTSLVITIPKIIQELQQIKPGDYLEITIEKINTEQTQQLKKAKNKGLFIE